MEPRKITIVQTKNQKKSIIRTSATTLGELKDDLRTNGIDYEGMTFYEGLTKTELKTDESILPHDIERNGTITNELVFMLTNTEKKIRSGAMSRSEAYKYIKENNLQDEVKKKLGRNFTQCTTDALIGLVENHKNKSAKKEAPKPVEVKEEIKEEIKEVEKTDEDTPTTSIDSPNPECKCNCNGVDTKARAAIVRLVDILYSNGDISSDDKDEILDIFDNDVPDTSTPDKEKEDKEECPYTDDEINKMFRGIR